MFTYTLCKDMSVHLYLSIFNERFVNDKNWINLEKHILRNNTMRKKACPVLNGKVSIDYS